MDKLKDKLISLFNSERVTQIFAKDLLKVPLNEWQPLNDGKVRFKIIEKTEKHVVSITEWLETDTIFKHYHEDAKETIFVSSGEIYSVLERIKRTCFGKMFFFAGTIHEIEGKKGTVITVKFDFI